MSRLLVPCPRCGLAEDHEGGFHKGDVCGGCGAQWVWNDNFYEWPGGVGRGKWMAAPKGTLMPTKEERAES